MTKPVKEPSHKKPGSFCTRYFDAMEHYARSSAALKGMRAIQLPAPPEVQLREWTSVCVVCLCVYVCLLVAQLCPILCDPMGILWARILEWVAIPFSREDLPDPRIKPRSSVLQADSLSSEPQISALMDM